MIFSQSLIRKLNEQKITTGMQHKKKINNKKYKKIYEKFFKDHQFIRSQNII